MRTRLIILLVLFALIAAVLACAGQVENLRVEGQPVFLCPSATPRPTHTQPPTSGPLYAPFFDANMSWYQVAPNLNTVHVQWTGQAAGTVYLSFAGFQTTYPYTWTGSNGFFAVDVIPNATRTGSYPVAVPLNVTQVTVTIYAEWVPASTRTFTVYRLPMPIYPPFLMPPPDTAPGGIEPTPRPTYTPWPTPTEYARTDDFFLGDPVYTPLQASGLRLRYRMLEIQSLPAKEPDASGAPQSIHVWRMEIANVGSIEYDFFPAAQLYVSGVTVPGGAEISGIWGASLDAAEEAGITPDYDLMSLLPGESTTITLAAYSPRGTAYRIAFAIDATGREEGEATVVPGQNVVSWINEPNTVCAGEIEEP